MSRLNTSQLSTDVRKHVRVFQTKLRRGQIRIRARLSSTENVADSRYGRRRVCGFVENPVHSPPIVIETRSEVGKTVRRRRQRLRRRSK